MDINDLDSFIKQYEERAQALGYRNPISQRVSNQTQREIDSKAPSNITVFQDSWGIDIRYKDASVNNTDNVTQIAAADDDAVTQSKSIIIPPGTFVVDDNITIDSDVTFHPGAKLSPTTTHTITFNGNIIANRHQIFTGAGSVSLAGQINDVLPEWFGILPDDTDYTTELNTMFDSLPNGGRIAFAQGTYKYSDVIALCDDVHIVGSERGTKLHSAVPDDAGNIAWWGLEYGSTTILDNITLENLEMYGDYGNEVYSYAGPQEYGIRGYFSNLTIKNCTFHSFCKDAVNFLRAAAADGFNLLIDGCYFYRTDRELLQLRHHYNVKIINSTFYNCVGNCINIENDSDEATARVYRVIISNNVFDTFVNGISTSAKGRCYDVNITNNQLSNGSGYAILCKHPYSATVTGNIVHDNDTGIALWCKYATANNNICYNNATQIDVRSYARHTTLMGNIIFDNQDSPTQYTPIYRGSGVNEIVQIGNTVHRYTFDAANTHDSTVDLTSDAFKIAVKFTAAGDYRISQVKLPFSITGAPAGTIAASIYSDSAGLPDALVGVVSANVNNNKISTITQTQFQDPNTTLTAFHFPTPPRLVSGISYWIVANTTGCTYADGVTEVYLNYDADSGASGVATYDGSWALISAAADINFVVEYLDDHIFNTLSLNVNSPDIIIPTPVSDYRSIKWLEGETLSARIQLYNANTGSETSDQIRLSVGNVADVVALASTKFTFGSGAAGIDYEFIVNAESNDASVYWMEDEDYWKFMDSILFPDSEPLYLGTGADMSAYYDGSIGYIKTDLVAPSDLYIDCGTDKTILLEIPVYDDVRITPGSFDRPAVSDPAIVAYNVNAGGVNTYLYEFEVGDIASFTVQIPHSYKEGQNITAHVHWTPGPRGNEENGKTVGWKLDYAWANIDGTFPTMATADLSDACDGTDHKHQMTPEVTITGTSKSISSMLLCNIKRTDTGTDDTWAGTTSGQLPLLLEIDFHFPCDTVGSRTASAK